MMADSVTEMSSTGSLERLAAILAVDVAGFSTLMAVDQSGTHRRLQDLYEQVLAPCVEASRGRIFKRTGDGILAEFASAASAVRCALAVQESAEQRAAAAPEPARLRLRAGVSLGDVIVRDGDLYGDGVNQAARLEGIAGLGEVMVSESAVRAGGGTEILFTDVGLRELKNLLHPIRVFRAGPKRENPTAPPPATDVVPSFGHRPAIAIMPFEITRPEDKAFADGLSEDLISAVARWKTFPVLSRAASYELRARDMQPGELGRALGARYVHEGSVTRGEGRIVVRAHLVNAQTGESLLSERFEGLADDALELQLELARRIVGQLEPELVRQEGERARQVPLANATVYELNQRAVWHHYRYNRADNETARELFRQSLNLKPDYARSAAGLAIAIGQAAWCGWVEEKPAQTEAIALARWSVKSEPHDPANQFALGMVLAQLGRSTEAIERLRDCVRLNPSHAAGHAIMAACYNYLDQPALAITHVELALRLSPQDPRRLLWIPVLAGAHYLQGDYVRSLRVAREALLSVSQEMAEVDLSYLAIARWLVASMGQIGRKSEAAMALPLLRRLDPDLASSERRWARRLFTPSTADRLLDGLRKAGFK